MRAMPQAIAADFSQMALQLLSATTKTIDSDRDGAAIATEERYVYNSEHIAPVLVVKAICSATTCRSTHFFGNSTSQALGLIEMTLALSEKYNRQT